MLKNLNDVIHQCRASFDNLNHRSDIHIDSVLALLLKNALAEVEPRSSFEIQPFSILLINENGLRTDLPSSLLWYGATFWELDEALCEYQQKIKELREFLKNKEHSSASIKDFLNKLPSEELNNTTEIANDTKLFLKAMEPSDATLFERFLTDRDWWFQPLKKTDQMNGKTLDRGDAFQSSFDLAARVIVANSSRLLTIVKAFTASEDLRRYFETLSKEPVKYLDEDTSSIIHLLSTKPAKVGCNYIYYGAPGTGKSHQLNELTEGDRKIVTVFHPDTQNSDFIGSLKPTNVSGSITYAFRPGPFTTALLEALKNPEQNVYLVIEEINRAPAAAVFGELFQLLDRENGASKYEIDFTDPDMQAYINDQLKAEGLDERSKLSIPANLSLLATMNSSDQAVMPLDTAFKRRWSFRYMKLDFENPAVSSQKLRIMTTQGVYYITWKDFANKVVNHQLKEMKVPEDRLIGPFFLSSTELSNSETSNEAISGKLFVYLWDDVLRHKGRNIIFDKNIGTFGELHEQFIEGKKPVFSEVIESLIISNGNTADYTTGVTEGDE
ncbi:McrB family protein [Providencia sp. PROV230]|uniref:McrB family protein n=1 Tax=Providencia sp. PROV230 TaxID=2949922 RepID=UPI00234AE158|nr:AAA family ATPase [Providencia sp. PROV230]EJF7710451.1 AAA family ATPase [Providencia rettgeri]